MVQVTDTPAEVRKIITEYKINFKVAFANEDFARSLMCANGNIPQTFVVARDGHILKQSIGFSPETTPPLMRAAIEQALQ